MPQIAAIQMSSGPDLAHNLQQAAHWIGEAADQGCELVALPENFALMGKRELDKHKIAEAYGHGPIQDFLRQQAKKNGVWLVGGSIPLTSDGSRKLRSSCLLVNGDGHIVSRYDKIHLFDVTVPETGDTYRESDSVEPGNQPVVADTPWGRVGLAICYDLRFPELFRDMTMDLLVIPSAFTTRTGRVHWQILLQARAIENQCYVLAPDQGGKHPNGLPAWQHSMLVDPWGQVVAQQAHGDGAVMGPWDHHHLTRIRQRFPALEHRRL